jgi:hypothetical protein
MSENPVVKLIKQVGLYGLCGSDGCYCISFPVHRVHVDISCRKSCGAMDGIFEESPDFFGIKLRVYTHSLGPDPKMLKEVADEVINQLGDTGYDIAVRFCEMTHDYKHTCVYCSKEKEKKEYLCDECKQKPEAKEYDYSQFDFIKRAA